MLLVVPSLALVRQTLETWTREAQAEGIAMRFLAVCSDQTLSTQDDPVTNIHDLGIPATTDSHEIARFLSTSAEELTVVITTYQSSRAVSEGATKADTTFDLAIYDEAHKTVGDKDKLFAHLLYDHHVQARKRIFLTATERYYRGNSDQYVSMDDETIYGSLIHGLSFKEALEQEPPILTDYKIISINVTHAEIKHLISNNSFVKPDGTQWTIEQDASTLTSLIVLRKLIAKYTLKHIVSFHSTITRAQNFQRLNEDIDNEKNSPFDRLDSFHVSGKNSTGDRVAKQRKFLNISPSLITNARCLTEGVDLPAIDGVLFAAPKHSTIDIVQATGRALRTFEGKQSGYIIIPVVLDEETGDPSDAAFTQIIRVIQSLGSNDRRIIEEFQAIAQKTHSGRDRIVILDVDVPESIRIKFHDFVSNVELKVWERLSFGWHNGLEHLRAYVNEYDTARVPDGYKNDKGFLFGAWGQSRRHDFKKKNPTLTEARINALEAIPGWTWDPRT